MEMRVTQAAQRIDDTTQEELASEAPARGSHLASVTSAADDSFMSLLAGSGSPAFAPSQAGHAKSELNWSATIDRVRQVAGQVRQTDERAKSIACMGHL